MKTKHGVWQIEALVILSHINSIFNTVFNPLNTVPTANINN